TQPLLAQRCQRHSIFRLQLSVSRRHPHTLPVGEVLHFRLENAERYVRTPVAAVTAFEQFVEDDPTRRKHVLLDLAARVEGTTLTIELGGHGRTIERHEDPSLADDDEGDVEE
ncbi:MAG: hypothetical protein J0M20_06165, partial [Burkholderiales bacterium]|nr:hypothetical protein [Burkholderiales bacterium]